MYFDYFIIIAYALERNDLCPYISFSVWKPNKI